MRGPRGEGAINTDPGVTGGTWGEPGGILGGVCPGGGGSAGKLSQQTVPKKVGKLSRLGELLNTQKNVHFFAPRPGTPPGAPPGPGGPKAHYRGYVAFWGFYVRFSVIIGQKPLFWPIWGVLAKNPDFRDFPEFPEFPPRAPRAAPPRNFPEFFPRRESGFFPGPAGGRRGGLPGGSRGVSPGGHLQAARGGSGGCPGGRSGGCRRGRDSGGRATGVSTSRRGAAPTPFGWRLSAGTVDSFRGPHFIDRPSTVSSPWYAPTPRLENAGSKSRQSAPIREAAHRGNQGRFSRGA